MNNQQNYYVARQTDAVPALLAVNVAFRIGNDVWIVEDKDGRLK
jgi:hypothetical protein